VNYPFAEERGATANLPDEDYVTPDSEQRPSVSYMNGVEQEDHDIAARAVGKAVRDAEETLALSEMAVEVAKASKKPWTNFQSTAGEQDVAPEMVVDWVFSAGLLVIAGQRGSGKTLTLVTQALAVAGVYNDHPTPSRIRRKVIYVTEDIGQIRTLISGLRKAGKITLPTGEVDKWFMLVESERKKPEDLAGLKNVFKDMVTPNQRIDGTYHDAKPLLVLDTLAANVEVKEISSNGEMSGAVSAVRETFRGMPVWLITHISKADAKRMSKLDGDNMTAIGAQSLEGDVQGTAYLAIDSRKGRALLLGKTRFEAKQRKFKVETHTVPMRLPNVLGEMEEFFVRYNEITPEAPVESVSDPDSDAFKEMANKVIQDLLKHPGSTKSASYNRVKGTKSVHTSAFNHLEETKRIFNDGTGSNTKYIVLSEAGEMPAELLNDTEVTQ
jgi:hypothetical protein